MNFCPVYERTGGHAYGSVYPGPIGAILNPLLNGVDSGPVEKSLPYASSLCGRCFEVCPVRIDIPDVLVHLRGKVVEATREHRVPTAELLGMRAAQWMFERPGRLAAVQRLAGVGRRLLGDRAGLGPIPLPGPAAKWSRARDVPLPPAAVVPGLVAEPATGRAATGRGRPDGRPRGRAGPDPGRAARRAGRRGCRGARAATPAPGCNRRARSSGSASGSPTTAPPSSGSPPVRWRRRWPPRSPASARPGWPCLPGCRRSGRARPMAWNSCATPDESPLSVAELDSVDAVLTGASVGIAETGTFVLESDDLCGRRALSLVPDVHVCVVRADDVVDDVPAAIARLRAGRPLTWVSGPSATSDIELDRVEGVHGPRTLHLLVVEGDRP